MSMRNKKPPALCCALAVSKLASASSSDAPPIVVNLVLHRSFVKVDKIEADRYRVVKTRSATNVVPAIANSDDLI